MSKDNIELVAVAEVAAQDPVVATNEEPDTALAANVSKKSVFGTP